MFERTVKPEDVRAAEAGHPDPACWTRVLELGFVDICMSLEPGDPDGLALVAEVVRSAGRYLVPLPLVEVAVALRALAQCGHNDSGRLDELGLSLSVPPVVLAHRDVDSSGSRRVTGASHGTAVLECTTDRMALHVSDLESGDRSGIGGVQAADVRFAGAAREIALGQAAAAAADRAGNELRVLAASRLLGLAEASFERGLSYARERRAFGRPVASFQAVSHGFADLATALAGLDLLVTAAVTELDTDGARGSEMASMAFLLAAEKSTEVCQWTVHVHGGYGFMLEYDAQLYFRRSYAWGAELGPSSGEWSRLWRGIEQARSGVATAPTPSSDRVPQEVIS
jgi:hypothetical protein